ncbi:MAG: hypothetical protein IPK76_03255 [Lewinellaceae bacterium]|nr:hypothetical protein [Lewinellaceae bacterium]
MQRRIHGRDQPDGYGRQPDVHYLWSSGQTTEDLTDRAAGTYTVTVTDANGCTKTTSATITQPTPIVLSTVVTNVLCNGVASGIIDLSATGGQGTKTYLWTNGQTSQDISGLVAGTYTVTVTNANGCTKTTSATVTEPPALVLSTTQVNVLCNGAATGSINLTVSGGTGSKTYLWSSGQTTEDLNNITVRRLHGYGDGRQRLYQNDECNHHPTDCDRAFQHHGELDLRLRQRFDQPDGIGRHTGLQLPVVKRHDRTRPQRSARRHVHRYGHRCERLHQNQHSHGEQYGQSEFEHDSNQCDLQCGYQWLDQPDRYGRYPAV